MMGSHPMPSTTPRDFPSINTANDNPFASNVGVTQHQATLPSTAAYQPTTDVDNGFSFSQGPMGGEWNGSNAMTGKYDFGGNDTYSKPNSYAHPTSDHRQQSTPQWALQGNNDVPPGSPSGGKQRWNNMRGGLSKAAAKTGAAFSNAASKTGSAISNAASKTAGVARQTANETGHRFRDMNNQHQNQLNQNEAKLANTTQPSSSSQMTKGGKHPQNAARHERSFASGGGFLPGRKTDTYTTTERTAFGGTKTTVTTTQKASGGFIPYIPGKSTTTTTTTRDVFGNTRSVETNTQSRGGFGIIPLGPVGLAAVGAIAAKNAFDNHKDRRNQNQQPSQQLQYRK